MKNKDWFKIKRYPHIGFPVTGKMRNKWLQEYITNPEKIAKHSFLPFIHKTSYKRRFRKEYDEYGRKKYHSAEKKETRFKDKKKRELFYASHVDSLVFSYYAYELNKAYERKIEQLGISQVVTAYRAIPITPNSKKHKCNIDFANDIFKYILDYREEEFSVLAFDISSFFDNLDHKLLREVWMDVLDCKKLPPAHFNVYKNITRFSYVDIVDIFKLFQNQIFLRPTNRKGERLPLRRGRVSKIRYLKKQGAVAFCTKKEFLKNKRKLLQPSKTFKTKEGKIVYKNFGIPQGSPISAVLANMYLLHFDKTINDFFNDKRRGIYRRYSDDMVVVCPSKYKEEISELVYKSIENYKLEIKKEKTQIFKFKKKGDRLICGQELNGKTNWDKNFVYLGFEFDGLNTMIKSGSISQYYRNMKRSIRRSKYYASRKNNKSPGEIFKRKLYRKFTFKGVKRYRKYKWNPQKSIFEKSDDYNWGNFLSYAKKASKVMVNNKIKSQLKNHWKIFHSELDQTPKQPSSLTSPSKKSP